METTCYSALKALVEEFDRFDGECETQNYTDVELLWDITRRIVNDVRDALDSGVIEDRAEAQRRHLSRVSNRYGVEFNCLKIADLWHIAQMLPEWARLDVVTVWSLAHTMRDALMRHGYEGQPIPPNMSGN